MLIGAPEVPLRAVFSGRCSAVKKLLALYDGVPENLEILGIALTAGAEDALLDFPIESQTL
jgi:hypothetical protein